MSESGTGYKVTVPRYMIGSGTRYRIQGQMKGSGTGDRVKVLGYMIGSGAGYRIR